MSITYRTKKLETFESVALRFYGDTQKASIVAYANPGTSNPPPEGSVLTIPPAGSPALHRAAVTNPDEVAIILDSARFRYWTAATLTRSVDVVDTLELTAPFDPADVDQRRSFAPFQYKPLSVSVGGLPVFAGTLVGVTPNSSTTEATVSLAAYATPGVLNDCTPPPEAELEFNDVDLKGIAQQLCAPFGIDVVFESPHGAAFERVEVSKSQTVLGFLINLAQQRGLVISSTPAGALLFKSYTALGLPVAHLTANQSPCGEVSPSFSPQEYYSHITGREAVMVGTEGSKYTVKNPRLAGVVRPFVFSPSEAEGGDVKAAVQAKAGRMFANMAAYSVAVSTWYDSKGQMWAPGATIKLQAPYAMIYEPYTFMIRSVSFRAEAASRTATLDLVIPEAFASNVPEVLPWES